MRTAWQCPWLRCRWLEGSGHDDGGGAGGIANDGVINLVNGLIHPMIQMLTAIRILMKLLQRLLPILL